MKLPRARHARNNRTKRLQAVIKRPFQISYTVSEPSPSSYQVQDYLQKRELWKTRIGTRGVATDDLIAVLRDRHLAGHLEEHYYITRYLVYFPHAN